MENKRKVGACFEVKAKEYLENMGYEIVECNYRCPVGEIDIVAKDGNYLVFIEVKYRKNTLYGTPFEAVDYRKQNRIRNVARNYIYTNHINANIGIRFDVVGITGNEIQIIKNAF